MDGLDGKCLPKYGMVTMVELVHAERKRRGVWTDVTPMNRLVIDLVRPYLLLSLCTSCRAI
jgi:hypothetical protein